MCTEACGAWFHSHVLRILFPLLCGEDHNVSQTGLMKVEGFSDPDDYVEIESGVPLSHDNMI